MLEYCTAEFTKFKSARVDGSATTIVRLWRVGALAPPKTTEPAIPERISRTIRTPRVKVYFFGKPLAGTISAKLKLKIMERQSVLWIKRGGRCLPSAISPGQNHETERGWKNPSLRGLRLTSEGESRKRKRRIGFPSLEDGLDVLLFIHDWPVLEYYQRDCQRPPEGRQ